MRKLFYTIVLTLNRARKGLTNSKSVIFCDTFSFCFFFFQTFCACGVKFFDWQSICQA